MLRRGGGQPAANDEPNAPVSQYALAPHAAGAQRAGGVKQYLALLGSVAAGGPDGEQRMLFQNGGPAR